MNSVLAAYGLKEETSAIELFGNGLINKTWKVATPGDQFILQRINEKVFEKPFNIAHNLGLVAGYLRQHHPDYFFVAPVAGIDGREMIFFEEEGFFRMFPFVEGSHSMDVVETPAQAYEAAKQFGKFTRLLSGFDVSSLKLTIPHFHDLDLRFHQFEQAIQQSQPQRSHQCKELINELLSYKEIVNHYKHIISHPDFKMRVTHHDTKISNVLFDNNDKGICLIDPDTVMPGYFISDVGDMMRTYLSPVGEEASDLDSIQVRDDFYKAIVQGYYEQMKDELTEAEKKQFFFSGKFMIYMQALRFLTDHLNNDIYYGARYEGQNLVRALNQSVLLKRLMEKEKYPGGYIP
jgi:Ser/Thr protein kinase RdoA (MazF antagonist)